MLITLVTPTGHRPEAFELCKMYVERQELANDIQVQWVIVADQAKFPKVKTTKPWLKIEQYQAPKLWEPDYNTQRSNMEFALTKVAGEALFVIEDDDYYSPKYVQTMLGYLQHVDAATITMSKYFHITMPGYKENYNTAHGSLSQTAFSKWAIPTLKKAVDSGELYFDGKFWQLQAARKRPYVFLGNTNLSVGIKGLPGREGISPSHREFRDYTVDPLMLKLKEWIGEDYKIYNNNIQQRLKAEKKKALSKKVEAPAAPVVAEPASKPVANIDKL